jgi:hypothetical protein
MTAEPQNPPQVQLEALLRALPGDRLVALIRSLPEGQREALVRRLPEDLLWCLPDDLIWSLHDLIWSLPDYTLQGLLLHLPGMLDEERREALFRNLSESQLKDQFLRLPNELLRLLPQDRLTDLLRSLSIDEVKDLLGRLDKYYYDDPSLEGPLEILLSSLSEDQLGELLERLPNVWLLEFLDVNVELRRKVLRNLPDERLRELIGSLLEAPPEDLPF